MSLALLIVGILTLAAVGAFALVVPARISDLHASIVSCFETIEGHIEQSRGEDPSVSVLRAENVSLRFQLQQALDRVMALTHPAYLTAFRRQQMEAQGIKPAPSVASEPYYGEFGEETPAYPTDRKAFEEHMAKKRITPSVAPEGAEVRPAPARAS